MKGIGEIKKQAFPKSQYLIALGSNQRHVRYGLPRNILNAAIRALEGDDIIVIAKSDAFTSRAVGPSMRSYANAAAIIETPLSPPELLKKCKSIEALFGQRRGQKWSRRVLDLDIILWDQGPYSIDSPGLVIPHPLMRERSFVLAPAMQIARNWHDPITGLTIAHLALRLRKQAGSLQKH